eukprot:TRINITY_DN4467_c0_g2_i2.p1 TRINITY_DN4467_c0_g2~~TRINITY_DN4467_c0_g2_i2.p1  ORF type:complete len:110 (-),score=26.57 TRINITY_DN4467_c0_g2_i2:60-368(-)
MYISNWDTFCKRAEEIYIAHPNKTRYTHKYRHVDSQLVLKVTDDVTTIKFRTNQANDMKKLLEFNALMFKHTTSAAPTPAYVSSAEKAAAAAASSSSSSPSL